MAKKKARSFLFIRAFHFSFSFSLLTPHFFYIFSMVLVSSEIHICTYEVNEIYIYTRIYACKYRLYFCKVRVDLETVRLLTIMGIFANKIEGFW